MGSGTLKFRLVILPLCDLIYKASFQVNKTLPYLVANVIEILDVDPEELGFEEDGANVDLDSQRKGNLTLDDIFCKQ